MNGSSQALFGPWDHPRKRSLAAARRGLAAAALALAVAATPPARADLVAKINGLRKSECAARPAGAPLHVDGDAANVARELARGTKLPDALKRASYPASTATSLHVKGAQGEDGVRRELAASYCPAVGDARYSEIGVFRKGDEYWIVLASRIFVPPPLDPASTAARVLELVNAARAMPRDCGAGHHFEAAKPVTASATLSAVALEHSRDMAEHRKLGHPGSDGSEPADRVTRAGYAWRGTGENVASGQQTADAVVKSWLESPGHCQNIMEPRFTEMGIAFALAPDQNPNIYWTQVLAAPR
jgi:uncharacterized protein YkwD